MPFRSTSRIFAELFGALICAAVLAAPAAFASGMDTPSGVTSLPFNIQGARIMTLTQTGLGIGASATSPTEPLEINGNILINGNDATGELMLGSCCQSTLYRAAADGSLHIVSGQANIELTPASNVIVTQGNLGIGLGATAPVGKLDILAGGSYASPVIQMRQSNAAAYGINMGIDNAFDGGLVFSAENNGTATPVMEIGRSGGYLGVVIGEGYVESQLPPNNGLLVQGNVGVGMEPVAALDVNGGVRGNATESTACSTEGMIAYDETNHTFVYCPQGSGVTWTPVNLTAIGGFLSRTYHLVNNAAANNYYSVPWTNHYSYPAEAIAICQYNGGAAVMTTYITGSGSITDLCSTNSGSASGCNTTLTVPPGATVQVYYGLCNAQGSLYILY
jgi:hypothetical protein